MLQHEGEQFTPRVHVAPRGDDLAGEIESSRRIAALERIDRRVHLGIETDQVLRIVRCRVVLARRGVAGHIPEASQSRDFLGRDRGPRGGKHSHRREQPASSFDIASLFIAQVLQLARIAGKVVELSQRQVDVFESAVDDSRQRRPTAVE